MFRKISICFLVLLLLSTTSGCNRKENFQSDEEKGLPSVAAINYPTGYLASRLGEGQVEVRMPWPEGADPAWWQPDDEALLAILSSDLILLPGAGYGVWTEMTDLPARKVVDLFDGHEDRILLQEGAISHSHGPEGEHSHGEPDANLWLDPELMKIVADQTAEALMQLTEESVHPSIAKRLEAIYSELDPVIDTVERVKHLSSDHEELSVQASQPVFGYVASAIGLEIQSFYWEAGKTPPADELAEVVRRAGSGASLIFWEASPPEEVAETLEAAGVRSLVFPPCGGSCDRDLIASFLDSWSRLESLLAN